MDTTRILRWSAALLAVVALTTTACGGGTETAAGSGEVASLSGGDATTSTTTADAPSSEDFQQSLLDYAACMREHGVDFPDPTFDENGRPVFDGQNGGPGGPGGPGGQGSDDPTTQAAREACRSLMEGAVGGFQPDPEQQAEMRDSLLAFAACMRDQGVDFPDPTFDENGRPVFDGANGRPNGAGGPGQNEDPTFAAAREACQQDLPQGGPGGRGGPPGAGGQADQGGQSTQSDAGAGQ